MIRGMSVDEVAAVLAERAVLQKMVEYMIPASENFVDGLSRIGVERMTVGLRRNHEGIPTWYPITYKFYARQVQWCPKLCLVSMLGEANIFISTIRIPDDIEVLYNMLGNRGLQQSVEDMAAGINDKLGEILDAAIAGSGTRLRWHGHDK